MNEWKNAFKKLDAYKYLLLLLLFGVILMILPTQAREKSHEDTAESALEEILADSFGVGRIRVLVSENGVVAVCDGAENAAVRWDILKAIGSYTGFGSERITILKMSEKKGR